MAHIQIPDTAPRVQYSVGGTPDDDFTIPFPYFADTDIVVYVGETLQTITTGYTVAGTSVDGGYSDGTVTLTSTVTNTTVTIYRDVAVARSTDFPSNGAFDIEQLNTELDKLTAQVQQQENLISDRTVRFSQFVDGSPNEITDSATDRANKALVFDGSGNPTISTDNYNDQVANVAALATAAAASETAAAASETAAASSEASAAASEASASSSETSAAASETAALAAQAAAEAVYDDFDDRYLGVKTSNPSLDNDLNPLQVGALYFNSTLDLLRVYTSVGWSDFGTDINGLDDGYYDSDSNLALGEYAGGSPIGASALNVSVGMSALDSLANGRRNTAVGSRAGAGITDNDFNTAVGYSAGGSGGLNTDIGYDAGGGAGNRNTNIGYNSGGSVSTTIDAVENTSVGYESGREITTGKNNTNIGNWAGLLNDTGNYNINIGDTAGRNITSGSHNIHIGEMDAASATSDYQLNIGEAITGYMTNGSVTIDIPAHDGATQGLKLGSTLITTTADEINKLDGVTASTAELNYVNDIVIDGDAAGLGTVAVGENAGLNITGDGNTALGDRAGQDSAAGDHNTFVGGRAGLNATGDGSTSVGYLAGSQADSVITAVGRKAGRLSTGLSNTAVGDSALEYNTTGAHNTAVGSGADTNRTSGDHNVSVGSGAGSNTGSSQVNIGYGSGANGDDRIAIGEDAGNTGGGSNTVAIGTNALSATSSQGNVAVGYNAGTTITTGVGMTAVGENAAKGISSNDNTAVGRNALAATEVSGVSRTVAVGTGALQSHTTSGSNTAVGYNALYLSTSGEENTAVGTSAGAMVTTGTLNTLVGAGAGGSITSGNSNIVIGALAQPPSATENHQLNIGGLLQGELHNKRLNLGAKASPIFVTGAYQLEDMALTKTGGGGELELTSNAIPGVLSNNYVTDGVGAGRYSFDGTTHRFSVAGAPDLTPINAGSFDLYKWYRIETVGTTDFTAINAPDNNVGTYFLATGVGSGTGTAVLRRITWTDVADITSTGIDVTGTVTADGLTVDTDTLHVDATNNRVGIGTSSPDAAVHNKQTGDAGSRGFRTTNFADTGYADLYYNSGLTLQSTGNGFIRLQDGGNVGIGTTSPAKNLDVSGEIRASTGILFGSDTAAANTLDDYEEGEVTTGVYISDGTNNATMAHDHLYYTKIGNLVTVTGYVKTTSLGSVSGSIRITGLPFVTTNDIAAYSGISVGYAIGLNITANQSVTGNTNIGTSYINLRLWDSTAGNSNMQSSEWSDDGGIFFSVNYRTDS